MSLHAIVQKIRRAERNGTGATFTNNQLRELAGAGVLHWLALLESDEICAGLGITPPPLAAIAKAIDALGDKRGSAKIDTMDEWNDDDV